MQILVGMRSKRKQSFPVALVPFVIRIFAKHLGSDFIFILVFVTEILSTLNLVSKLLQSKNIDLDKVCSFLDTALQETKSLRDNFDNILAEAKSLALKWDMTPTFIYYYIVTNQIDSRFTSLKTSSESDELLKHAINLKNKYPMDIGNGFTNKMILFQKTFKSEIKDVANIADLVKLFTITYCDISCTFTEVIVALMLYLTLPVSVATAERSFSTLKRIKTHLRTTMTQDRLSALGILAIEAEEAAQINVKDVIEQFAGIKARKKQFV